MHFVNGPLISNKKSVTNIVAWDTIESLFHVEQMFNIE